MCWVNGFLFIVTLLGLTGCKRSLRKDVEFTQPARWSLEKHIRKERVEALIFSVDTAHDNSDASVVLTIEANQEKLDLKQFGDLRLSNEYSDFAILTQTTESSWRSVLSRAQKYETPYCILDCFGIEASLRVHFRVAWAIKTGRASEQTAKLVADINTLLSSLKLCKAPSPHSSLKYDGRIIWLEE
jgi:hypothetical protein